MFAAIIVAAGSSRRAGFDKLAAPLGGKAVLRHSIDAFVEAGAAPIVVVCPEERWTALGLDDLAEKQVIRVDGGAERHHSVQAGLSALPSGCDYVAVHDGARPLILVEDILRCLDVARETGAAACAHPVVDTLKRADTEGNSLPECVDRTQLWGMETPQIFERALLEEAYALVQSEGILVTDEVSALESLGRATRLVPGGFNRKITLPDDLALAELVWQQRAQR